ncbi:MAG: hypothetical protein ABI091_21425 [Ferruginibacter sp.]
MRKDTLPWFFGFIKERIVKNIVLMLGCLAAFSVSSMVLADSAHPCKPLEVACKAAGFYQGGSGSGKGLYKDCIEPLADGKSVSGVKVADADAAACKVKVDKMR